MSAPGIILANPSSGPSETSTDSLRAAFPGAGVVVLDPDRIDQQVREALGRAPAWIGVAGGDGTIRSVVQVLAGGDVALLPIPAGTHNHLARALGIDDLDAARAAVLRPPRRIDLGEVSGRYFLNNSSIGLYPQMVRTREEHQRRLPKWAAQVTAGVTQLRKAERLGVTIDGDAHQVWMVFIGNNCYGNTLNGVSERSSLTEGVLDLRAVLAERPGAKIRFAADIALGRLDRSSTVLKLQGDRVTLAPERTAVELALDGEVETMAPPLEYRSRPALLLVHAGPDDPTAGADD